MRLAVLLAMPTSRATALGPSSEATPKQSRIESAIETDRRGSPAGERDTATAQAYRHRSRDANARAPGATTSG
jgi:hypothetical protein